MLWSAVAFDGCVVWRSDDDFLIPRQVEPRSVVCPAVRWVDRRGPMDGRERAEVKIRW